MPKKFAYLAFVSHPPMVTLVIITVIMCCAVKALVFLVASIVAMHTKDDERRKTCLKLAKLASRMWPRPPRRLTRPPKS